MRSGAFEGIERMARDFTPPPKAGHHCRHYSYRLAPRDVADVRPQCAVGQSFEEPGSTLRCMPPPKEGGDQRPRPHCPVREEWNEAERARWDQYRDDGMARLVAALAVLPRPIPMRSGGNVPCPSCDGGTIRYDRWWRGASLTCSTLHCCNVSFNIADPTDWPQSKDDQS
jgi:hypothetical protein